MLISFDIREPSKQSRYSGRLNMTHKHATLGMHVNDHNDRIFSVALWRLVISTHIWCLPIPLGWGLVMPGTCTVAALWALGSGKMSFSPLETNPTHTLFIKPHNSEHRLWRVSLWDMILCYDMGYKLGVSGGQPHCPTSLETYLLCWFILGLERREVSKQGGERRPISLNNHLLGGGSDWAHYLSKLFTLSWPLRCGFDLLLMRCSRFSHQLVDGSGVGMDWVAPRCSMMV